MALLLAYFLGSVPFGLLLTKLSGAGDIRAIGSGNIGATNVLRTGNKKLAALTLLLDAAKGALAVYVGERLGAAEGYAILTSLLCGLAAVLGHVFPFWLKFKGGKGVATGFGTVLMLSPPLGALMLAVWLVLFAWKRISSLAALGAYGAAPLLGLLFAPYFALYALLLAALIFFTHRANISRLLHGNEHRFSARG